MSLIDLGHRANLDVYSHIRGKPMVIYEDHRSLVYVLWHAMHIDHLFSAQEPPLLIYFDGHDDGKKPTDPALATIRAMMAKPPINARDLYSFIEWDLSPLDDDWLVASFELGLIGDAISIGVHQAPNFASFHTRHTDHRGQIHNVWKLGHLWGELGHQGALSDHAQAQFRPLWDALRWNPSGKHEYEGSPRVVLDMDLDCFATVVDDAHFPWPDGLLRQRFHEKPTGGCKHLNAVDFLAWLEPQVAFRTIARESPYCGGTHASQRILHSLDRILWDNAMFPF